MNGADLIQQERQRQIAGEGFVSEHDDGYTDCELLDAALCYAGVAGSQILDNDGGAEAIRELPKVWPWELEWWKPSPDPVRNLVKAGALIAAEIDRLNRSSRERQ